MTRNRKLFHALLVLSAGLNLTAATAEAQRVGSREGNDHPRVGSRESTDRPRVGSHESANYQRPVNVQAFSAAPSFQPAYQPMHNSNFDRRHDHRWDRDDDDRPGKRFTSSNPAMCWPVPTKRSRRAAMVKARAAKPVAVVAKKPMVAPPEPEVRTWTDITGRYTTVARFSGMVNESVVLRKLDDTRVEVPVSQLSAADQDWVESRRTIR